MRVGTQGFRSGSVQSQAPPEIVDVTRRSGRGEQADHDHQRNEALTDPVPVAVPSLR